VSGAAAIWTAYWRESDYLRSAFWLTCAVGSLVAVLAPFALWNNDTKGILEVFVAAGSCLVPGLIALWISTRNTDPHQVLFGFLLSMGLRIFPPLMICLVLSQQATGAEYFSFICYLLLFYLVTLALETYLSVRLIPTQTASLRK
jgi:hypothetical protein